MTTDRLQKLFARAQQSAFALWQLNRVMHKLIPFNGPHKVRIKHISDHSITTAAPFLQSNFNHLRGMHACCIITIGEYAAGINLLNHFAGSEYRIILSQLKTKYYYQAKGPISAQSILNSEKKEWILETIAKERKAMTTLLVQVTDNQNNLIAEVETQWQVKPWKYTHQRQLQAKEKASQSA